MRKGYSILTVLHSATEATAQDLIFQDRTAIEGTTSNANWKLTTSLPSPPLQHFMESKFDHFFKATNRLPGRFQGHNESSPPRHPCPALGCSRVHCKKKTDPGKFAGSLVFDGKNTHPLLFLLALGAMFLTQWSVTHHMLLFVASEPLLITSLFTSQCSILFYGHPGMSKIGCFKMSKALV